MSKNVVVIGAQWGDEGKGKIVDLLAERFDIVARYQGGHNAGHSVYVGDKSFVLRLLPSGITHPGKICVRLFARQAIFQAGQHCISVRAAVVVADGLGVEHDRLPHLNRRIGELKVRRHYAGDLRRQAVEHDAAAGDAGIAVEASRPQRMADQHDRVRARLLVSR